MTRHHAPHTTLASFIIATAVVLSGTHAKDFATLTLPDTKKQVDDLGAHIVKVAGELHNHVDKSVKIQPASDAGQADGRSLRLMHDSKKESALHNRLADRLRLWWQLNTLYLS